MSGNSNDYLEKLVLPDACRERCRGNLSKYLYYDNIFRYSGTCLIPNTIVAHWIYLVAAGLVLAVAYVLFKMKYYHLHEEYLASLKK